VWECGEGQTQTDKHLATPHAKYNNSKNIELSSRVTIKAKTQFTV